MDERDDDGFEEEYALFDQDGPDLFGAAEPPVEEPDEPTLAAPPSPIPDGDPAAMIRPDAPLALYRRYRPEVFAQVIGQEHVTEPLQRALTNNRVNHAYLFSGPRGCGKTTSARILARALNCAAGPTPVPCGKCQSCTDLARGGAGSIDVIEIDAASHGGVNEARDLRERAFFAPVHSRYKIYIIDEAHMVTKEGFNALLKVVEEPPPHVKFIFATTEPEKVLGTIRSRTHHYPFRLVPPKVLGSYLSEMCASEGVSVEPTVLPLVVRAGAGSVRDSLSVLDQLLGGASEGGVTYAQAATLLGYTPDALLDEIVDAFAAADASGVFAAIDKVIEVGQDPRRFAEDLLRRLRDLIIVAAVPDAITSGLIDVAADQAERLVSQARVLGPGELTRAAEVLASGLTEMRGTTAPRLHLELMCARVLLPGADVDDRGLHARLDRLERRLQMAEFSEPVPPRPGEVHTRGSRPEPEPTPPPVVRPAEPATSAPRTTPAKDPWAAPGFPGSATAPVEPAPVPVVESTPEVPVVVSTPEAPAIDPHPVAEPTPVEAAVRPEPTRPASSDPSGFGTTDLRRLWPEVLDSVKNRRRFTWILLSQNAQVVEVRDDILTLGMSNAGARESFARSGNADVLKEAIQQVVGVTLHVQPIIDANAAPAPVAEPVPAAPEPPDEPTPRSAGAQAARDALKQATTPEAPPPPEVQPSREDATVDADLSSDELLRTQLGAELIEEDDQP